MAARILDLCDGIVSLIRANWQPTSPDAVSREYAPEIPLVGSEGVTLLTGRKVYVIPPEEGGYASPELMTRGEFAKQYTAAVIVVERYTGTGQPPVAWIDARVNWVEANVANPLRDPAGTFAATAAGSGFALDWDAGSPPVNLDQMYDRDLIQQRQAFWSLVTARYRELEPV